MGGSILLTHFAGFSREAQHWRRLAPLEGSPSRGTRDLADDSSIRSCFSTALEAFGNVHVLVANAGYMETSTKASERELLSGDFSRLKEGTVGNLWGTMLMCHVASHHWATTGTAGVCVVSASTSGIHGVFPLAGANDATYYLVAKAGQIAYIGQMQGLANNLKSGCRYFSVLPGLTWSNIWPKIGLATPEAVQNDPVRGPITAGGAGWTPIEKLLDLYVDCIEGSKEPGTHWVMGGQAGVANPYRPRG
ncbi:hypothetical protein DFJ74DRAFT_678632 [Hyaloraphidium curvatum]|nr:hypothetical protein DFJ74DRAFT_678632 [Hyaloraphidium curvatum]